MNAGDSDPLPRSCFRLWDQRFTVQGGLRLPRAVSSGPSTGRARPKPPPVAPLLLPQRPALRLFWGVCAGTSPTEWCISVACSTVKKGTVVLLPVGPIYHGTPETQLSWQGATGVFSHRQAESETSQGHSSPD